MGQVVEWFFYLIFFDPLLQEFRAMISFLTDKKAETQRGYDISVPSQN